MENVEGVHRLTPTQAGMLYEILSSDDPSLYFEQVRADISTPVQTDSYRAAWQSVLDRHEALRTIIVWDGLDEPVQVVRRTVEVNFEFLDYSDRADPASELDRLANLQRESGIELSKAPLSAVTLVKLDEVRSHLIWNFHHIIADGWSAAIVMDDVLAAYDSTGSPAASHETEAPKFSDYIGWVLAQDRSAGLQHWKNLLAGVEAPTRFALSSNEPVDDGRYLARQNEILLDEELADQIQTKARDLRVTTNTVLQGACALALSAFSNESDVTFGVTTGGRPSELPGIERAVGMYLKTLPFRADTAQAISTAHWLSQLQDQQLSADEHAHIGLAEAIATTDLAGAQSPFDLVWIYENFPKAETERGLEVLVKSVFEQTNYPMTIMAGPKDGRLSVNALYNGNLLSDDAVAAFLSYLGAAAGALVAGALVAGADKPLNELNFLSLAETATLVQSGEGPKTELSNDLLHELFDAQAARRPHETALIGDGASLTYDQLRTHSNWLAADLVRAGVTPGSAVGVQAKRSVETVIAMLAVVKAGAAYVPLDPSHPQSRRETIIADAQTVKVLTSADLKDLGHSEDRPAVERTPQDPLLITFTSGSTGAPKGVPVHHRGVINRLQWQWDAFGSDPTEVMTHKTSFTFVDHLFELWGGLLAGRSVVVIGEDVAGNPDEMINVLARHNVSQISLVPSLLAVLCEFDDLAIRLPALKLWTVSGEPMSADLAQRFYDLVPQATLVNLYGMSEASQDSTWFQIPNPVGQTVPIGQAISNMTTYVVGPNNRLSPNGVVGELCLSGDGLSLGYLNRPDLTADKFTPNPFGPGTLYRTGDLARRRSDGNLELVGRVDRQVKIRGVRVEPEGVETALRSLDSVDQAAVISVDSTLVAYVVGASAEPKTVRSQMAELVPDAMVPTTVVIVDAMPLTASGKLDRQSLPAIDTTSAGQDERHSNRPDRSEWSPELTAMIGLWSDLLNTQVGPDDDFFSSGGHSLMGLRLFSRIKKDLGYSLSLSQLATANTPRTLLAAAQSKPSLEWTHLVPMSSEGQTNLFCMHGAGGNILNLRDLASALAPQRRLIAVKATGADDDRPLPETMDELLDPYVAEIDQFQPTGALAIAGFSNGGLAAYEVARRLIERGRTISGVILLDTFHPSAKPQAYGLDRHLDDIKRDPIGTIKFKANEYAGKARIAAIDKFDWASSRWEAEATHANLMRNNIKIWAGYVPTKLGAKVSLLSAADTHPNWLHLGSSRQWPVDLGIEVVTVPGDHTTHVEGENAPATAEAIQRQLAL